MSTVMVSIAGGQASGKKTVLAALEKRLLELSFDRLSIATLHMSYFAKRLPPTAAATAVDSSSSRRASFDVTDNVNGDEKEKDGGVVMEVDPEGIDAFDLDALAEAVEMVAGGDLDPSEVGGGINTVESRGRSSGTNTPRGKGSAPDVLLVEGSYLLCHKRLLEMANIKVFVDLDADVRLGWRVLRDTETLQIPLDDVFDRYVRFGKRAFEETIYPTKNLADIILPRGPEAVAIDLIAMGVWDDIRARKDEQVRMIRAGMASLTTASDVGAAVVGEKGVGIPGHFSPMRAYSPTRPYVPKSRITIGEADLENFYDSI